MLIPTLMVALLADTIAIVPMDGVPDFDGRATVAEYGAPSLLIDRPGGVVQLWLRRAGNSVWLAAHVPDSTYYWGDDIVISLCTAGDRAAGPQHDDFQWYLRRAMDSSVVLRGESGKWRMPRDDPDWRLGPDREGGGWEVRSVSEADGWSLELKLDPEYFTQGRGVAPALAFRIYDNSPRGWHPWPAPPGIRQPTEVERRPELWATVSGI